MRYYRLEITDKDGNTPSAADGTPIGPFDTKDTPGRGLHIEFDALIAGYDVVNAGTLITIHGLPITMLNESVNLVGCHLSLYAGFTKGLPLETDLQGNIISGEIYNPYANWIGTHQTLNLIVNPEPVLNDKGQAAGITLDGKAGEKIGDILRRGLTSAYPEFDIDIRISSRLVATEKGKGHYDNFSQLATVMKSQSFSFINSLQYTGVRCVMANRRIQIFDNSVEGVKEDGAIKIQPYDLIGQPTWISINTMSFKCPLRSDIHCGDIVELPQDIASSTWGLLAVNTESSLSAYRDRVNFSGKFLVLSVRHIGEYLNPNSSDAWVTVFEAIAVMYGEAV